MNESPTVQVVREGALARVVLDRPDVRNALDDSTILAVTEAVEGLQDDDGVRVIVLAGRGKHFCAGADLNWMKRSAEYTQDQNLADARDLARLFTTLHGSAKPVIARVQGAAIGGGAGLVAAADIAIATQTSTFGFSEVRLGIIPAVISPFVLARLGPAPTRARFLTGERFKGPEALRLGLVDRVVAEADLDAAVEEAVASVLAGGPEALRQVKALLSAIQGKIPVDATEVTSRMIAEIRTGSEAQEGMAAFLEKRKPGWMP